MSKRKERSAEECRIRNQIKKGILPAYVFAKHPEKDAVCETQGEKAVKRKGTNMYYFKPKRTWRMISTLHALLGDKK